MKRMGALGVIVLCLVVMTAMPALASHGSNLNCDDFDTQAEAQRHMDAHSGDPDNLDGDSDGVACEGLPGGGGVEATATTGSAAAAQLPIGLGAIAFGGLAMLAVRRLRANGTS